MSFFISLTFLLKAAAFPQPVFSSYIDPKHEPAARRWHSHRIDLGTYAGQTVTLIFETSAGPAGDGRYDWAGWGLPRLLIDEP